MVVIYIQYNHVKARDSCIKTNKFTNYTNKVTEPTHIFISNVVRAFSELIWFLVVEVRRILILSILRISE